MATKNRLINNCNACSLKRTCVKDKLNYKQYVILPVEGDCSLFEPNSRSKHHYYEIKKELDVKIIFLKLFQKLYPDLKNLIDMDVLDIMNMAQAVILKNWGIETGKPDIQINIKNKNYSGLCLEFKKTKSSKVRPNQLEVLKSLSKQDRFCVIVWDSFSAIKLVNNYLQDKELEGIENIKVIKD